MLIRQLFLQRRILRHLAHDIHVLIRDLPRPQRLTERRQILVQRLRAIHRLLRPPPRDIRRLLLKNRRRSRALALPVSALGHDIDDVVPQPAYALRYAVHSAGNIEARLGPERGHVNRSEDVNSALDLVKREGDDLLIRRNAER